MKTLTINLTNETYAYFLGMLVENEEIFNAGQKDVEKHISQQIENMKKMNEYKVNDI